MKDKETGLYGKFHVDRIDGAKEGAEYFVLDYVHDPLSRYALMEYAWAARHYGFEQLASDLIDEIERTQESYDSYCRERSSPGEDSGSGILPGTDSEGIQVSTV